MDKEYKAPHVADVEKIEDAEAKELLAGMVIELPNDPHHRAYVLQEIEQMRDRLTMNRPDTVTYKHPHVADMEKIEDREAKALLAEGLRMILAIEEGRVQVASNMVRINPANTFYHTEKLAGQIKVRKCREMLEVLRPETETGNKTEK